MPIKGRMPDLHAHAYVMPITAAARNPAPSPHPQLARNQDSSNPRTSTSHATRHAVLASTP
jgi:hypothetical protein